MVTKTFFVPNISCNHCVMTIKREVSALDCVSQVEAHAENKQVTITYASEACLDQIRDLMEEINYPIAS